jgi:DNA helicase-2/ATP-dependent DNA helicase PcrA
VAAANGRPAVQPAADAPTPRLELSTGDKVRHAKFGEGIVTGSKPSGADVEVTVAFADGNGIKRLLLSFAPLEKVQ